MYASRDKTQSILTQIVAHLDYSAMVKQRSLGPDNMEDGNDPSSAFLDALRTRAMDEMHEASLDYGKYISSRCLEFDIDFPPRYCIEGDSYVSRLVLCLLMSSKRTLPSSTGSSRVCKSQSLWHHVLICVFSR